MPTRTIPAKFFNTLPLLAILAVTALNAGLSEITKAGDGVGWDGRIYADAAASFYRGDFSVVNSQPSYHLQRLLPSLVVAGTMRALGVPPDQQQIVLTFKWLNFALIFGSLGFWYRVANNLKLSPRALWSGSACLFLTFLAQKQVMYFPVSTDTAALFLSSALLYCYLAGNRLGLVLTSIAAAYTWPTLFYAGMVLLIWPNTPIPPPRKQSWLLPISVTVALLAWSGFCLAMGAAPVSGIVHSVLPLSFFITGSVLFFAYRPLLPELPELAKPISTAATQPVLYFVILAVILHNLLLKHMAAPGGVAISTEILRMSVEHLAKPGISLLAAVVYFGPVVLFAAYRWSNVCGLVKDHGFGLLAVFSLFVTQLLLDSEAKTY